jgi:hypothetical protein
MVVLIICDKYRVELVWRLSGSPSNCNIMPSLVSASSRYTNEMLMRSLI